MTPTIAAPVLVVASAIGTGRHCATSGIATGHPCDPTLAEVVTVDLIVVVGAIVDHLVVVVVAHFEGHVAVQEECRDIENEFFGSLEKYFPIFSKNCPVQLALFCLLKHRVKK